MNTKDNNFFNIENEVVFVTGAGGQLGKSIIMGLLSSGSKVVAVDISIDSIKKRIQDESESAENLIAIKCDVTKKKSVISALKEGQEHFGKITSLVANAGVSVFEPFMERSEESIDYVMNVNLKGTLLCIQQFLDLNKNNKKNGSIVSIGSHYGLVSPDPRIYKDGDRRNSEIYGATKAGVIQMTKYFAIHASEYNVRVNAVSPGGIRNPDNPQSEDFQEKYNYRSPMGRMAETEEIIGAVLFLLSPAASYINGHNIVVDGGFSAW